MSFGKKREGAVGSGPEPDWRHHSELDLLITLQGDGLRSSPQSQRVKLYKSKDGPTVYFEIEPLQSGSRTAWVMIYLAQ